MRKRRRALTRAQQKHAASRLFRLVATSSLFRFSRRIAFSLANDGEISPHLLLQEAQQRGKQCYLPVLHPVGPARLQFKEWKKGHPLHKNQFGIPEPRDGKRCAPRALSLVLMPLVAFDATGNRLGMGKGYYDRTFAFLGRSASRRPRLLGLAHECQRVEKLEVESWDLPLDGIVTDEDWYGSPSVAQQQES